MNKKIIMLVLSITIGLFVFISCENEDECQCSSDVPDIRLKWIGTYRCMKELYYYPLSNSIIDTVLLQVTLGNGDTRLYVKEDVDSVPDGYGTLYLDFDVFVDTYGDIWGLHNNLTGEECIFKGDFNSDSIYVRNSVWIGNGGLIHLIYKGVKIRKCE